MTRAKAALLLVLMSYLCTRWLPLAPLAPPTKEQEPPDKVWTVVARCENCRHQVPPPEQAIKEGTLMAILHLHHAKAPPLATAIK